MQDELKVYDESRKLSYEELKGSPVGIDLTRKEVYGDIMLHFALLSIS